MSDLLNIRSTPYPGIVGVEKRRSILNLDEAIDSIAESSAWFPTLSYSSSAK